MYCAHCGTKVEENFRYCASCGASTSSASGSGEARSESSWRPKGLSRPREGKKIAGVCAGVARYLDLDVTLVRLCWILITIFPPLPGIILYIICWIIMPLDPPPVQQPFGERTQGAST